jgi:hypothetical protein
MTSRSELSLSEAYIMAKEHDKKESEHLPLSVRDFLDALLKKMRYRRKVREDVRAELAAHFEDEMRGCPSGEEKEKRARQLVTEFGDLKLLAKLLRRAKKRCRPLWRTVIARTFQVARPFPNLTVLETIRVAALGRIHRMAEATRRAKAIAGGVQVPGY